MTVPLLNTELVEGYTFRKALTRIRECVSLALRPGVIVAEKPGRAAKDRIFAIMSEFGNGRQRSACQ